MKFINADELKKAISNSPLIDFTDDDIFKLIDNAPTVEIPNYGGQVVPDTLQGWRYEERPHGEWIYPYHDTIIGKKRVGKSIKQCSVCDAYFCNNIPWDAKYCPICGSYNEESNGNAVDNI